MRARASSAPCWTRPSGSDAMPASGNVPAERRIPRRLRGSRPWERTLRFPPACASREARRSKRMPPRSLWPDVSAPGPPGPDVRPLPPPLRGRLRVSRNGLPDQAALRPHHRVARLAGEGRAELGDVRRRPDRAEAPERVRIRIGLEALELRPAVGRPDPRPVQKKALLGREAVDLAGPRLSLEALLERLVGDRQSSKVRDR